LAVATIGGTRVALAAELTSHPHLVRQERELLKSASSCESVIVLIGSVSIFGPRRIGSTMNELMRVDGSGAPSNG
jgi:hypothetical protein